MARTGQGTSAPGIGWWAGIVSILLMPVSFWGLAGAGSAAAKPPVVRYPTHAAFSMTPNGGGFEGQGQTVAGTITSPKAACSRNRRFQLDYEDPTGYVAETHTYRTNGAGRWTLDIVASPGPGRIVITVPPKGLDRAHRCQATRTVVPI